MNLSTLPEIAFSDLDPAHIESVVITGYEKAAGKTLFPGDPVRLYMESLAYVLSMLSAGINLAGRQSLLATATGAHLDYIGMMVGVARLGEKPAVATFRFTLAEPRAWAVLVPEGSRVSTGNNGLVFAVDHTTEIAAGQSFVTVRATCTTPGVKGNGFVPGQINKQVDVIPYVKTVENSSTSILGADIESDDRYRMRIHEAPESFTCAGPSGSYRNLVLAVHQDIADVGVWSPVPGTVDIRPVMVGGELPPPEILDMIRETLSADTVRPLTDTVIVAAPVLVEYSISGGWYLSRKDSALTFSIGEAVTKAVETYRLWQRSKPGRDINPDYLQSLVKQSGAKRLVIDAPVFTPLEEWQLARESAVDFQALGIENE